MPYNTRRAPCPRCHYNILLKNQNFKVVTGSCEEIIRGTLRSRVLILITFVCFVVNFVSVNVYCCKHKMCEF
jgi:hypothetical protein